MARSDIIINNVIGPDVLDIGCAGHEVKLDSKYWLHGRLREKFSSVVGIDYNAENVKLLEEAGFSDVFVANAEDFHLDQKFDSIVAGELIEHLTNPGMFLNQCREHLKTEGRVIITTPYVFSLLYILYALVKFPHTCQNGEHTAWFCPSTLHEISGRYGFMVEKWELIEDYEFDNPSLVYRAFAIIMTTLGRIFLPKRLRNNTMLFLLKLQK